MMSIDAPPVHTGVLGGERGVSVGMGLKVGMGEVVHQNMVVMRRSFVHSNSYFVAQGFIFNCFHYDYNEAVIKGVAIGESSSSKPPQSTEVEKGKGKSISV